MLTNVRGRNVGSGDQIGLSRSCGDVRQDVISHLEEWELCQFLRQAQSWKEAVEANQPYQETYDHGSDEEKNKDNNFESEGLEVWATTGEAL